MAITEFIGPRQGGEEPDMSKVKSVSCLVIVMAISSGASTASFVMDHGRSGPLGALGGRNGGVNKVVVMRNGTTYHPPHLSKDQGIAIEEGDTITVSTPGGGGFGDPLAREPALVARDVKRGYYTLAEAEEGFGVVLDPETLAADEAATRARRDQAAPKPPR